MNDSAEFPPLSLEFLQPLISTKWLGRPVLVFNQIESTNSYALQLAEKGISHGTVVLADGQTGGRGRFGRDWHSPSNVNLYFSVILNQLPPQSFTPWIPLATGIALAESIEKIGQLKVTLKWPNDVLIDIHKISGILCESSTKGRNGRTVIVGVGINVNSREGHFPPDLRGMATSLAIQVGHPFDRHALLATVFSRLEFYYERVLDSDFPSLQSNYTSRCSTLGRPIQVSLPGNKLIKGIASHIGHEGELHVIPSNLAGDSMNKKPTTIAIRAGDVIHLR